jgi:membrane protease YdiL (CAAX protease family)
VEVHAEPDERPRPPLVGRILALIEVLVCSDYPTQFILAVTLNRIGLGTFNARGVLSTSFVVVLSVADTAVLLALIVLFLRAHQERPRDVFLGRRSIAREATIGVALTAVALLIGIGVLGTIQSFVPSLHNVPHNPLQDVMRTRLQAIVFACVVTIAGGIREEIQRGFVLRRFEQYLGGGVVGLIVFSAAFGLGHLEQGHDVAIATAALGAFWGAIFLLRRSIAAPMVAHAGFNLAQVAKFLIAG